MKKLFSLLLCFMLVLGTVETFPLLSQLAQAESLIVATPPQGQTFTGHWELVMDRVYNNTAAGSVHGEMWINKVRYDAKTAAKTTFTYHSGDSVRLTATLTGPGLDKGKIARSVIPTDSEWASGFKESFSVYTYTAGTRKYGRKKDRADMQFTFKWVPDANQGLVAEAADAGIDIYAADTVFTGYWDTVLNPWCRHDQTSHYDGHYTRICRVDGAAIGKENIFEYRNGQAVSLWTRVKHNMPDQHIGGAHSHADWLWGNNKKVPTAEEWASGFTVTTATIRDGVELTAIYIWHPVSLRSGSPVAPTPDPLEEGFTLADYLPSNVDEVVAQVLTLMQSNLGLDVTDDDVQHAYAVVLTQLPDDFTLDTKLSVNEIMAIGQMVIDDFNSRHPAE